MTTRRLFADGPPPSQTKANKQQSNFVWQAGTGVAMIATYVAGTYLINKSTAVVADEDADQAGTYGLLAFAVKIICCGI